LTPAVAAIVAELEGRAPAAWLDRVATLRRDGRTDDADALLAELRRRYPDEPLPEAFR
jgi:TolA-binding protein